MSNELIPVMYFIIWLAKRELWRLFPRRVLVWFTWTCVMRPRLMDKSRGY